MRKCQAAYKWNVMLMENFAFFLKRRTRLLGRKLPCVKSNVSRICHNFTRILLCNDNAVLTLTPCRQANLTTAVVRRRVGRVGGTQNKSLILGTDIAVLRAYSIRPARLIKFSAVGAYPTMRTRVPRCLVLLSNVTVGYQPECQCAFFLLLLSEKEDVDPYRLQKN